MKKDQPNNQDTQPRDPQVDTQSQAANGSRPTADAPEVEELKGQLQRSLADYANLKKRFDKERTEISAFVIESVMTQLLPAIDNLDRAVQHATDQDKQSALYQGLDMTVQQLAQIFSDLGIQKIITQPNVTFDPHLHEAVDMVAGPTSQIVNELSTGYTLNQKVIRPARVTVGNGEDPPSHFEKHTQ